MVYNMKPVIVAMVYARKSVDYKLVLDYFTSSAGNTPHNNDIV